MLYEFKSRATGSVVMTQPVAERVLEIIGKEPGPKGIVTVDQMPEAIAALEKAVAEERARQAQADAPDPAAAPTPGGNFGAPGEESRGIMDALGAADDGIPYAGRRHAARATGAQSPSDDDEDDPHGDPRYAITLAQRAWPFVEMMKAAHKAGKDITWGI